MTDTRRLIGVMRGPAAVLSYSSIRFAARRPPARGLDRRAGAGPARRYPRSLVGTEKRETTEGQPSATSDRGGASRADRRGEAQRVALDERRSSLRSARSCSSPGSVVRSTAAPTRPSPEVTLPPVDTTSLDTHPTTPVRSRRSRRCRSRTSRCPTEIPDRPGRHGAVAGRGPRGGGRRHVVTVNYVGVRSADGTEFDTSYDRGATVPV